MIDHGKRNILGVMVDAIDYEASVDRIVRAGDEKVPCSVTALAVHGLMHGALDKTQRYRLNEFDLVVPDGQQLPTDLTPTLPAWPDADVVRTELQRRESARLQQITAAVLAELTARWHAHLVGRSMVGEVTCVDDQRVAIPATD